MDWVLILRWLHVIGATVLFGTGSGIAFFMVMAVRSGEPRLIAHVAGTVVLADLLFTATAVIAQPVTGVALALGWPLSEGWIVWALGLYLVTGAVWLPVVWIQVRLRDIARDSALRSTALPARFHRLYLVWCAFGVPAFAAVLAILWLMLARPDLPSPF